MTPEEAPVGSVVVVGHPANGVSATKQLDHTWVTNTHPRRHVNPEDLQHGGACFAFIPEGRS